MNADQDADTLSFIDQQLADTEALLASLATEGIITPDAACVNTTPLTFTPTYPHNAFSSTFGTHSPHKVFGPLASSTGFTLPSSLSPTALGLSSFSLMGAPVTEAVPSASPLFAATASSPHVSQSQQAQPRGTSSGQATATAPSFSPRQGGSPPQGQASSCGASPAVSSGTDGDEGDEMTVLRKQLAQAKSRQEDLAGAMAEKPRLSSPATPSTGTPGKRGRGRPARGSTPVSAARLEGSALNCTEITELQTNIYELQSDSKLMGKIHRIAKRSYGGSVRVQNRDGRQAEIDLLKLPPAAAREVQDIVRKEKAKVDQRTARAAKKEKKALAAAAAASPEKVFPFGAPTPKKRGRKPKVESNSHWNAQIAAAQLQGYGMLPLAATRAVGPQFPVIRSRSSGPSLQQPQAKRQAFIGANGFPTPIAARPSIAHHQVGMMGHGGIPQHPMYLTHPGQLMHAHNPHILMNAHHSHTHAMASSMTFTFDDAVPIQFGEDPSDQFGEGGHVSPVTSSCSTAQTSSTTEPSALGSSTGGRPAAQNSMMAFRSRIMSGLS